MPNRINIMTSCDNNLIKYIYVQLKTLSVYIEDTSGYMELASKGGGWVGEAYFSLLCHEYLPESVDRILYIDAVQNEIQSLT